MQTKFDKTSFHFVYVVDEEGMNRIFADFKQKLAFQHDVTLIRVAAANNFTFNKELEILQKRYSSQLMLYTMIVEVVNGSALIQEVIEAVINSNTKDKMIFIMSQDEELIHVVSNVLWFLGISKDQIRIC